VWSLYLRSVGRDCEGLREGREIVDGQVNELVMMVLGLLPLHCMGKLQCDERQSFEEGIMILIFFIYIILVI
jgi:hypothetical protein